MLPSRPAILTSSLVSSPARPRPIPLLVIPRCPWPTSLPMPRTPSSRLGPLPRSSSPPTPSALILEQAYVITNAEGKGAGVQGWHERAFQLKTVGAAKSDPAAKWILNTSDGSTYQLLNAATKTGNLDVDNSGTSQSARRLACGSHRAALRRPPTRHGLCAM